MILHMSPTCLCLSPTCLPVDPGCSDRVILHLSHLSALVSHLFPTRLWMLCPHDLTCLPLVSACFPLVGCRCSARMILHVSPTCLPLDPGCSARMILHLSRLSVLVPHLSPTRLWVLCPRDFTFVSHLAPLVSPLSR